MPNQVRVGVGVGGVGKASSDLDKLRDKFDKLQKQGAKGFAIGAGAAITAKGLSLVDSAAHALVNVMGDATEAAIAEEESLAKLDAALRANVAGWDGNTKAIEDTLKSRMRLGFSDDEQRQSLALLVVATNDETKALEMQRAAMDLARLKGISLMAASEALTRVEGGQFRMLKGLGIQLEKGATATDALAAVQKAAQGQAESYAETNRGKLLVSQVKVGEAMEKFGAVTMPMVVTALEAVADATVGVADHFDSLAKNTAREMDAIGQELEFAADFMTPWDGSLTYSEIQTKRKLGAMRGYAQQMFVDLRKHADTGGDALDDFADTSETTARKVTQSLGSMADAFDKTWSELAGTADQAAEDIFGPLERRAELAANKRAQSEALGTIAAPGSTKDEIADARQELIGLQKDFFTLTAEMAGRGELTAGELSKLTAALKEQLTTASLEEQTSILNLIVLLDRLRAKGKGIFTKGNINVYSSGSGQAGGGGRASGGGTAPFTTYTVGENGPEKLTMGGQPGYVTPNTGDASAQWLPVIAAQLSKLTANEPMAARPATARGALARDAAMMPGGRP